MSSKQLDQRNWLRLVFRILAGIQRGLLLGIVVIFMCDSLAILTAPILPEDWLSIMYSYQPTGWTSDKPFLTMVILIANGAMLTAVGAWFAVLLSKICLSFLFCGQYSLRNLILFQMVLFLLVGLVFFGNEFATFLGLIIASSLAVGGGIWLRNNGYWLTICPKTGELKCLSPVFGMGRRRTAKPSGVGSLCPRISSPDHVLR